MPFELIGLITYGQLSNIILALGMLGCLVIVSVVTYIAITERTEKRK